MEITDQIVRQRIAMLDERIEENWQKAERDGVNQLTATTLLRFYELRDRLLGIHKTIEVAGSGRS